MKAIGALLLSCFVWFIMLCLFGIQDKNRGKEIDHNENGKAALLFVVLLWCLFGGIYLLTQ